MRKKFFLRCVRGEPIDVLCLSINSVCQQNGRSEWLCAQFLGEAATRKRFLQLGAQGGDARLHEVVRAFLCFNNDGGYTKGACSFASNSTGSPELEN
jgi:hypothetical protein